MSVSTTQEKQYSSYRTHGTDSKEKLGYYEVKQHNPWYEEEPSITTILCVISGLRREVAENCALQGYYTASSGNLPLRAA
jgi:hypothetical protein